MPDVTQKTRSNLAWTRDSQGRLSWTGSIGFQVINATDWDDAEAKMIAAYPYTEDGEEHPQGHGATVVGITRDRVSQAGFYELTVNYSSEGGGDSPELLLTPPEVKYEPYTYVEASDRDLDGIPFLNTADSPFDQPMPIEKTGIILTISRWEVGYPLGLAIDYGSAVCNATFSWLGGSGVGGGSVEAGQAKCIGIFQGARNSGSLHTRVEYKFDLRREGHQYNVIDQGAVGWFLGDDGKRTTGLFVGGMVNPQPVGSVRLTGTGVPISDNIYVMPAAPYAGDAQDATGPSAAGPITEDLVNTDLTTADITVLTFRRHRELDFGVLGLA